MNRFLKAISTATASSGASDLDLIRANWGNAVPPGDLLSGDANADGTVNAADLDVVRANWGAVAAADAVFDSLADEPAYGDPVYDEPVYGPALPETATLGRDPVDAALVGSAGGGGVETGRKVEG